MFPLKNKFQTTSVFMLFLVMMEKQFSLMIKAVQIDSRGEFMPLATQLKK